MYSLVYCFVLIVKVVADFQTTKSPKTDSDSDFRIQKLSTCAVNITNYGVVNLKSLAKVDGYPRFSIAYKDVKRTGSAAWNYSFNPCVPYNEPYSLTAEWDLIFGDKCQSVSVCKFGNSVEKKFYYTYGTQESADFSFQNVDKPLLTLSFRGIGGNKKKTTNINLICDKSLKDPDDAIFTIVNDHMRYGVVAELRHACCCPDLCTTITPPVKVILGNSTTVRTSQRKSVINSGVTDANSTLQTEVQVTDKKKANSTTLLLIVGLNIGLLLAAGVIGIMCYSKRSVGTPQIYSKIPVSNLSQKSGMNFSKIDLEKDTLEMPNSARSSIRDYEPWMERKKKLMMPVFDDCVIPNDSIELAQRLGGSVYGDTYVGDVKGLKVAVTRITLNIHKDQITAETLKWLTDEVWFLSRQRHRNIVAMLGICTESKFPYFMSEFIEGFTVKSYMQNKWELMSWPLRVKICLQAADGVAYLHSTKPPIIHRDLRCANLFISEHEIVKVGDYGLIKLIQPLRKTCQQDDCCCQGKFCACPSSVRWTAPEILNHPDSEESDGFISPMSDVYSFGVVMWETVMCDDPFDEVNTEQEVIELVREGIRPSVPVEVDFMPQYKTLMNQCWNGEPENRPSFKQIASKFKELISPARTFQKNISNKLKLRKLQQEATASDLDLPSGSMTFKRTKYDSVSESVDLNQDGDLFQMKPRKENHKKSVAFK